ncbi:hypothetical protein A9974_22105 [Achromobacter sp. UMC71]|nr:hypothetical protein [Achromobacter sp. UMC71]
MLNGCRVEPVQAVLRHVSGADVTMTEGHAVGQALLASVAGFWLRVVFSMSERPIGRGWFGR